MASTSAYRRSLLERFGLAFTAVAPQVEETAQPGEAPLALVMRLALAKARAVAVQQPEAWVIGSDQIAVLAATPNGAQILGKPGTAAQCAAQLTACAGHRVQFLTAVALVRHRDGAAHSFVDTTTVHFRPLDTASIARYVELESPLDCAGGFKCEGLGITLFDSIESQDPTALVGLPLIRLAAALRGVGYRLP